jgi:hypothetical protein
MPRVHVPDEFAADPSSHVWGMVPEIGAAAGTQVAPGRLLVRIEPDPPSPPPGPAA